MTLVLGKPHPELGPGPAHWLRNWTRWFLFCIRNVASSTVRGAFLSLPRKNPNKIPGLSTFFSVAKLPGSTTPLLLHASTWPLPKPALPKQHTQRTDTHTHTRMCVYTSTCTHTGAHCLHAHAVSAHTELTRVCVHTYAHTSIHACTHRNAHESAYTHTHRHNTLEQCTH